VTTAGVPPAVLEKLRAGYRATIEDPEVANVLRKAGIEEVGAWSPTRIGEQMQADYVKWGEIIRKANIKLDG
jgi:tripartite-type tricarboxylate transporter receptor subunit TctC